MTTITDEVGHELIYICTPTQLESSDDLETTLDGRRHSISVNYRPNAPLSLAGLVTTVDDGPAKRPANDSRPARYHLKGMAQRGELGINEPENGRHWFVAERLKLDIAISSGELRNDFAAHDWPALMLPYIGPEPESFVRDVGLILNDESEFKDSDVPGECAVVDNAEGEYDQTRILRAGQVISLAKELLGNDFAVLQSIIVNNWTLREVGERTVHGSSNGQRLRQRNDAVGSA